MSAARKPRAVTVSRDEAVEPDRLFVGLDGRAVSVAGGDWMVNVFGVSDQAGHRWVQLAVAGSTSYMLTLCLSPGDGVAQALLALSSFLTDPASSAAIQVLTVG